MHASLLAPHPFGVEITPADLKETFSHCRQWEDRYRQLILLGRQLPALPDALKTPDSELSGCENRVWLGSQIREEGSCIFTVTAKVASFVVCWPCCSPLLKARRPRNYWRPIRWICLNRWACVRSLAPHAVAA